MAQLSFIDRFLPLWIFVNVIPGWFGLAGTTLNVSMWSIGKSVLLFLGVPLATYFLMMFGLSMLLAKRLQFGYPESASLAFTAAGNNFELPSDHSSKCRR